MRNPIGTEFSGNNIVPLSYIRAGMASDRIINEECVIKFSGISISTKLRDLRDVW